MSDQPLTPGERHVDAPAPGEPVVSHYHLCFGCGVDHPTGLHMQITAGEGLNVTAEFEVGVDHQGAPGLAHGGMLTTAIDETLSAINWLLRSWIPTAVRVDLNDPDDPTPYWFISTRKPVELVRALQG